LFYFFEDVFLVVFYFRRSGIRGPEGDGGGRLGLFAINRVDETDIAELWMFYLG
jgi:hypothetical protein